MIKSAEFLVLRFLLSMLFYLLFVCYDGIDKTSCQSDKYKSDNDKLRCSHFLILLTFLLNGV